MDQIARSPKQLGQILRRHRKKLGSSQGAISAQTSLRQSTISTLESSTAHARLDTLFDVLSALDLELVVRPRTTATPADIEALF